MDDTQSGPPSAFRTMMGAKLDAIEDAKARDRDEIALRFACAMLANPGTELRDTRNEVSGGIICEIAYGLADGWVAERAKQNGGDK